MEKCGFKGALDKASPPSEIVSFLGVLFNTLTMTIEITPDRLVEIRSLFKPWINRDVASLKQGQSLIGKLKFIVHCV